MKRKNFLVLMGMAAVLTLTACGNSSDSGNDSAETEAVTEAETAAVEADTEEETEAAEADTEEETEAVEADTEEESEEADVEEETSEETEEESAEADTEEESNEEESEEESAESDTEEESSEEETEEGVTIGDDDTVTNLDTDETETEEETEAVRPTYTASDYVVLGEYTGLTVEVAVEEITDEDVLEEAELMISYSDAVETLTEGTVEDGDTVDITYVGTIDGEEFDGGSGDYELEIGSGTFIEGFEEGLIGVEVGETVDLDLTFPEDYYYTDLAGVDVVFTVTVNGIQSVPELSDEVVEIASDGEYTDVDSYLAYIREYLEEDAEYYYESDVQEAIYAAVAAGCEVEDYPQDLVDYCMAEAISYYEYYAELFGMEYEDFIEAYFGSVETFEEELEAAVKDSVKEELILMAIAEAEELDLTDEEYEEGLEQYAEDYGYDSGEDIEAEYGETEMRRYILLDKVFEFLVENNTVEQVSESETESESESETEEETDAADDAEEAQTDAADDAEEETEADTAADEETEAESTPEETEELTESETDAD
ncbi:MAG: trigger factor [Lachnospiraceae bacterium]|nr:trigger factor [Lachnospiraceae bacterium]